MPTFVGAQFDRNLQLGDSGVDVLELQKFLNKSTTTAVALFGPGSLGNETMYFGEATKQAVIRFQNENKSIILSPLNLTFGSGYVGEATRAFIADLLTSRMIQTTETNENTATTKTEKVLFDAISELSPNTKTKSFSVLNEMPGSNVKGSGCIVSYGANSATKNKITGSSVTKKQQEAGKWTIGEWYLHNNFCQYGNPRYQGTAMIFDVVENDKQQKMIYLSEGSIRLLMRSAEIWKSYFGGNFYRDPDRIGDTKIPRWPMLLLTRRLDEHTNLNKYNQLLLSLDVIPRQVSSFTATVDGVPPVGAKTAYNDKAHAARFRMNIPLQWRPAGCETKEKRATQKALCASYGRIVWTTIQLMDDRPQFMFRKEGESFFDEGSGEYNIQIDMRDFIKNGDTLKQNPLIVVDKKVSLSGDMLPALKRIVLSAEANGIAENDPDKYVPARLRVNGVPETDEEYLSHFGVNTLNIGYETTGLSFLNYEITKYRLVGVN